VSKERGECVVVRRVRVAGEKEEQKMLHVVTTCNV